MTTLTETMAPTWHRVTRRHRETADTFTLTAELETPFEFAPGQFNMVSVFGVGEAAISISGDPDNPHQLVHTIRAVGSVTNALDSVREGDLVGVRGPYGKGWPLDQARGRDVIIVAGGIGLAPLRPALLGLLNHRDEYGSIAVVYGARSPSDLLYTGELHEWRARFDIDLEVTVDRASHDWFGHVGVVTRLVDHALPHLNDPVAFLCGPEIMMRVTAARILQGGGHSSDTYLSLERNMKCGIGLCGHCQYGPDFICKDGPVLTYTRVAPRFLVPEI